MSALPAPASQQTTGSDVRVCIVLAIGLLSCLKTAGVLEVSCWLQLWGHRGSCRAVGSHDDSTGLRVHGCRVQGDGAAEQFSLEQPSGTMNAGS